MRVLLLLDMIPGTTRRHVLYGWDRTPNDCGDLPEETPVAPQSSDLAYIVLSENVIAVSFADASPWSSGWMRIPAWSSSPTLADHVRHVIGLGSEEEMFWSDAPRVVAPVKHAHSYGDGAVGEFVGDTMSATILASFQRDEWVASDRLGSPDAALPVGDGHSGETLSYRSGDWTLCQGGLQ